jgi:hypothetical protein
MNDCPTCQEYEERIKLEAQNDYRTARDWYDKYLRHKLTDHILHIATTNNQIFNDPLMLGADNER